MPFISKFIAAEMPELFGTDKEMIFPKRGLNPVSSTSVAWARSFNLYAEWSGF
jgi:hypothetical protein